MTRKYAANTHISVTQTIADIQSALARFGADRFARMTDHSRGYEVFRFDIGGLTITFGFTYSPHMQERQRQYRAAFASIKGKLISVADGIETPAQAFYAHVRTDNDQTMFERTRALLPDVRPK